MIRMRRAAFYRVFTTTATKAWCWAEYPFLPDAVNVQQDLEYVCGWSSRIVTVYELTTRSKGD